MLENRFIKGLIAVIVVFISLTAMTYIGVVFLGYGFNPAKWTEDNRQGISIFYMSIQVFGAFISVMAQTDIAKDK